MALFELNINLDKIDKDKIFVGKKGKYYKTVIRVRDEEDQYGNKGFCKTATTKEEREQGYDAAFLGNLKEIDFTPKGQAPAKVEEVEDDLPF